jgi:hypothetical protein
MGMGRCRGITRRWRGELRVGFAFREQGHGKEGEVHKKEDALWVLSEVSGLPPQKIRQLKPTLRASRSYRDEPCRLLNTPEGIVSGLWRDNLLERQTAPNGDCDEPGFSPQNPKSKQQAGTNLPVM